MWLPFEPCARRLLARRMPRPPRGRHPLRWGFSLLELMVALSIMVLVVGSLGALVKAVNEGARYGESYGTATQHARVAVERIAAGVRGAAASGQFPGILVVTETVSGYSFPDTLVVWRPDGSPVDPDGLPRMNELRIYCPDRQSPRRLMEITLPGDTSTAPFPADAAAWRARVATAATGAAAVRTVLTDMLRTSQAGSLGSSRRGDVRFAVRYRPSQQEIDSCAAGSVAWSSLAWPQGLYSGQVGIRQAWVQMELQLVPDSTSAPAATSDLAAVPFLGSASLFYEVHP
ncbi:MAG: PilW family protein [Thermoguttaceae bacterium]